MLTFSRPRGVAVVAAVIAYSAVAACGNDEAASGGGPDSAQTSSSEASEATSAEMYPDILEVQVTREDEQTASFAVTVSSPYDSPERYADGWRVLDQDGEVLGEHTLGHDHASEQPFTRTQSDVNIPSGTTEVTIEGRDQVSGYGGETVTVQW